MVHRYIKTNQIIFVSWPRHIVIGLSLLAAIFCHVKIVRSPIGAPNYYVIFNKTALGTYVQMAVFQLRVKPQGCLLNDTMAWSSTNVPVYKETAIFKELFSNTIK